jgi:TIR domain
VLHEFGSYLSLDRPLALRLVDALWPPLDAWLDRDSCGRGFDRYSCLAGAIRTSHTPLFLMSGNGVEDTSLRKQQWTWVLSNEKPVIPPQTQPGIERPFVVGTRRYLDLTASHTRHRRDRSTEVALCQARRGRPRPCPSRLIPDRPE